MAVVFKNKIKIKFACQLAGNSVLWVIDCVSTCMKLEMKNFSDYFYLFLLCPFVSSAVFVIV